MANTGQLSIAALSAQGRYDYLIKKYGNDPSAYRKLADASLIGSELAEGYSKWANANLQASSIEARQNEVRNRTKVNLANLARAGESVQAQQATSFIKSGVKLEGAALDVLVETSMKTSEALIMKQREADFDIAQQEVMKRVAKAQAKFAPIETAVNIGVGLELNKM